MDKFPSDKRIRVKAVFWAILIILTALAFFKIVEMYFQIAIEEAK